MSEKNPSNPANLTRDRCRRAPPVAAQPRTGLPLWLGCAAALALCLTGCPTQDAAESLPDQDVGGSFLESEILTPQRRTTDAVDPTPGAIDPPAVIALPDSETPADDGGQLLISGIEPEQGPTEGGISVAVEGRGFVPGTKVFFGEVAASMAKVVDDGLITAVIPPHDEGAVPVSVESPDGIRLTAEPTFRYVSLACLDYDPTIDTDQDGLANGFEICGWRVAVDLYGFGTDDPDGLHYYKVFGDPYDADTDDDGLSDYDEYLIGSDPEYDDTDYDGLKDAEEVDRWLTSPVSVDSDGDANGDNDALPPNASLFDGAELKIDFKNDPTRTPAIDATSPIMADTDGDGRSDYEELDHTVLSPVIADLPALELEVVDEIDVLLNVEYAEEAGTSTEYGTSFSRATTTSQHWYTGGSVEVGMGVSVTVGTEASGGILPSCSAYAETTWSANVSYSQEWQVGGEKSQEMRNESSRLEAKSRTHTETVSSGAISTGIVLTNTGPVSYRLSDLGMTVRLFERGVDPDDPLYVGSFKTVATLVPTLGESGFTLAPGQSTPVLQVQAEDVNVDRVRDFLRDPHALHLEQAYFEMETAEGLNYGFIEEATQASTATVMIDFGDGEWHKYRFATNVNRTANGSPTGVRLGNALELLGVNVEWAIQSGYERRIVKKVQKDDGTWVPEGDPDTQGMWVLFGTNDDFDNETLHFDDITLHAGDVVSMVFSLDADGDGVFGWEEDHYGSSDDADPNNANADYDRDGLTDAEEVNPQQLDPNDPNSFVPAGWDVQVGTDAPYRVFSDPRLADGDEDGLNDLQEKLGKDGLPPDDPGDTGDATDPNKRDTDADGIDDSVDTWPLNPARILRVDDDIDPNDPQDGATWATAYSSLQDAISEAQSANDPNDPDPTDNVTEIWVAQGSYTFTEQQPLLSNVGIYGGFTGGETKRAQRTSSYGSVIDGTDHPNQRAFYTQAGTINAVLDGFQISSWYSNANEYGGAVVLDTCDDVLLRNVLFIGNKAINYWCCGGALFVINSGSVTLEDCIFANNTAVREGGAAAFENVDLLTIDNCLFESNAVDVWTDSFWTHLKGGALRFYDCNAHVSNSRFTGNSLGPMHFLDDGWNKYGGALSSEQGSMSVENCEFTGNSISDDNAQNTMFGGAAHFAVDTLSLLNCLFHRNMLVDGQGTTSRSYEGSAVAVYAPGPSPCIASITNCTFVDNYQVGGAKSVQLKVNTASGSWVNLVNVLTAYHPDRLGESTAPGDAEAGIGIWHVTNPRVYFRRLAFAREQNHLDVPDHYTDWHFSNSNPGEVMWLDPASDAIFEDWDMSKFQLDANSLLVDWGTNFVDVDPATPGYQFLPELDLDGKSRIVDGDGDGVATVDIGAYEYSPY